MFEFVKTSNLALDELSKKDKKYTSILAELKKLLSEIKGGFLTFDKAHKKVEQSTDDAHKLVKERFNEKIKMFNLNLDIFTKNIDVEITKLEETFNLENTELTTETERQIEIINNQIKSLEQRLNEHKTQASLTRSKDISDISKVITQIKKQSTQSIEQLESVYKTDLSKLMDTYEANEAQLRHEIISSETTFETDKLKINEIKNFYREQSDKKYLSIKNDYHLASTDFNKSVDLLKKEKETLIKKITATDEKNRLPIEEALEVLKTQYETKKLEVETFYKDKVIQHKARIETLTQEYNTQKDAMIVSYGDAISLINSKLSSFRDVVANERLDKTNQLKLDIDNALNEDEIKALKKGVNKQLRQQENELNRQIIRTEKETSQLLKSHYLKLEALETKFLSDKSQWRILGKQLVIDQKLDIFNNEQNYQYQLKSLHLQLKTLKSTQEFELDRVDTQHLVKIAPLDLKLSIANAVSEKDVNLLSNDTNYHLNHYQHQEDTLTHNFVIFKLTKEHELEILKLTKEHSLSVLNMSLQLSIDKENVIREQQLSNQQLKKDYVEYTYQKYVSTESLTYLKEHALLENDIVHLEKTKRSYQNYLSDKRMVEQSLLKHKRTHEETNIHYLERSESVDMTNEMMTKDLEVIHSRIHYLFNQVYLIYNVHHHFMLSLIQIYEIPAHPEDVKQYIQLYIEVFQHLNTLQEHAKDQFLVDLNTFQELKINDLTALKLKTDIDLLESEYLAKIKSLDEEITSNDLLISQIEERIMVLSTHVDRVQFELNQLDQADDKKALLLQEKALEKQLNGIEMDMALMDKRIFKYNKMNQTLMNRKEKLMNELDKKRATTTLKNQNEAKTYLKQRSFYINSVKQITQLFDTYEDKVLMITKKIDQPLYLTDNIMREYQKGYLRIEDYFEKSSNQLYQALLKGSVKLFDQLIHQQNNSKRDFLKEQKLLLSKLDKQQLGFEDKLKQMSSDFKHHVQLLSQEKEAMIKNIQTTQFKSESQDILNQQKRIQTTEQALMSTESNLKKEMHLIDDNLKSVIQQMHSDFEKQVVKLNIAHDKNVQKHVESLQVKAKNLKALEESTQLKNNQLSLRFTQTEGKLIDLNKDKLANFEQSIQKKHQTLLKKIQGYSAELKHAQDKKDLVIQKNTKRLAKFSLKIQIHEKRLLTKDLKDAKESYAFKQRTLKL